MSQSPEIQAAILEERRRCVGLTLREFGIARLRGATDTMETLDRLAIYMENPEKTPED